MAKITKVEMYVVDPDEEYYDLIDELCCQPIFDDLIIPSEPQITEKYFEWNDNVVVNQLSCTKKETEDFFKECDKNGTL